MSTIAILVGNSNYETLDVLECCKADVAAMKELLSATEKYSDIATIIDQPASKLKDLILEVINRNEDTQELLFYFTGHGDRQDQNFFYCAVDYKRKEPNVTGLSDTDLDNILRTANARTVVKIIDACHSGARLIKAGENIFPNRHKSTFDNFFRIASCHDNQYSSAGNPLSLFTKYFIEAALHKNEGKVLYSYIISRLSDTFENHDSQIPFFNTQGDYRTSFCDNAELLKNVRIKFDASENIIDNNELVAEMEQTDLTQVEKLIALEDSFANKDKAQEFISNFGDAIWSAVEKNKSYTDYYEAQIIRHSDFQEPTTKIFVVRTMSKQTRPDKLVDASVTRKKKRNKFGTSMMLMNVAMGYEEDYIDEFDLELNCSLENVQIRIAFAPKFKSLKQIVLVVSFAPSLPTCYVFEHWSLQALTSWDGYEYFGSERNKRWYKFDWDEDHSGVVKKITNYLDETIEKHINGILSD